MKPLQPAMRASRSTPALLAACVLLLAACATTSDPGAGPASAERAERLLRQNNPAAAAQMYERLAAANTPPSGPGYALSAARAWLAAGRPDDAQRALTAAGATLTDAQRIDQALLQAELLAARGQYANAARQLAAIREPADPAQADRLFHLQQQVHLRAGQPVEAVQAGMARDRVASTDSARAAARRDLLNDLRQAIDRGVRIEPASVRDPLVRGWLEIGQVASTAGRSPVGAGTAVQRWQDRYPGHPAATVAMAMIVMPGGPAPGGAARAPGTPIGLLLPLTGAQAVAASLVRDGFQAGLAQLPQAQRPELRLYDTGAMSVDSALQQARADGVGLLVGPLTRPEVLSAAQLYNGTAPLLLLNSLGATGAPRGIYQFALSPEDEARQIARAAWTSGQRRALVLAPTGDWGTRVSAAFTEELTRAGGSVIRQSNYDPSRGELTGVITQALRIDDSRNRHRRLEQLTGATLVFEPRRRDDIDMIIAAGQQPQVLRQIQPQLRFFGAADLPTYMTSDGYDPDPLAARDLEGIRFPDMPWVLDGSGPVAETRTATQPVWGDRGVRPSRLFAFGYDAATLALSLGVRPPGAPLSGLTGRLRINEDGRVERELNWARIVGGAAQPIASLGP